MAEYIVVKQKSVYQKPENISFETASAQIYLNRGFWEVPVVGISLTTEPVYVEFKLKKNRFRSYRNNILRIKNGIIKSRTK